MRALLAVFVLLTVSSGCDFASLFAPPADDGDSGRRRPTNDCESDDDCGGGEVCDDGDCVEIAEGEGENPGEGEGENPGEGEGENPGEGEGEFPGEGEGENPGEGEGENPGEGEGESDDVVIDLTWNTADGDLDLHLNRAGPPRWCDAQDDCHYGETQTSWGATLEIDDLRGFGPERIRLAAPFVDGIFTVGVGLYSRASSAVTATVTVRQRGQVLRTMSRALDTVPWMPLAVEVINGVAAIEVLDIVEAQEGVCWGVSGPP
jgi:hypothetical protein